MLPHTGMLVHQIEEQAPHYGADFKVLSQLSSMCTAFNNLIFYNLGTTGEIFCRNPIRGLSISAAAECRGPLASSSLVQLHPISSGQTGQSTRWTVAEYPPRFAQTWLRKMHPCLDWESKKKREDWTTWGHCRVLHPLTFFFLTSQNQLHGWKKKSPPIC